MVAHARNVPCEKIELEYTALKFMNIACYCKDKAEHDNDIAKQQLAKSRSKRRR